MNLRHNFPQKTLVKHYGITTAPLNDIASASNFEVRLFADDTALIMQDKNPSRLQEKIEKELINIELFLRKNKLTLYCDKTT